VGRTPAAVWRGRGAVRGARLAEGCAALGPSRVPGTGGEGWGAAGAVWAPTPVPRTGN